MTKLLSNPTVRLIGRAIIAGIAGAVVSYRSSGGVIVWHALAVAFVLAFAEIFTPLNALVGVFKGAVAPTPPPAK